MTKGYLLQYFQIEFCPTQAQYIVMWEGSKPMRWQGITAALILAPAEGSGDLWALLLCRAFYPFIWPYKGWKICYKHIYIVKVDEFEISQIGKKGNIHTELNLFNIR